MTRLRKAGVANMPIGKANVPIKIVTNKGFENFKGSLDLPEFGISIAMEVQPVTNGLRDRKTDKEISHFVKCAIFKSDKSSSYGKR